jgi:hypothetical protein
MYIGGDHRGDLGQNVAECPAKKKKKKKEPKKKKKIIILVLLVLVIFLALPPLLRRGVRSKRARTRARARPPSPRNNNNWTSTCKHESETSRLSYPKLQSAHGTGTTLRDPA